MADMEPGAEMENDVPDASETDASAEMSEAVPETETPPTIDVVADVTETGTPASTRTTQQQRTMNANIPAAPLDVQTADVLMRIYLARRIEYQKEFYTKRIREFDSNSDTMFRLGALVMSLSSLFAALSLQGDSALLRLITAILPAFAALIASFRQLYQWDRQSGIYRDTILGLSEAQLVVPDNDLWKPTTGQEIYKDLVEQAEQVFKEEVSQWGQVALGSAEEEAKQDAMKAFAEEYGLDILNADGTVDESRLGALRDILAAGVGTPDSGIEISYPELTDGEATTDNTATDGVIVDDDLG